MYLLIFAFVICAVVWVVWSRSSARPRRGGAESGLNSGQRNQNSTPYQNSGRREVSLEPSHDNWEGSFWDVAEPFPVKATLKLKYKDGVGSFSERIVDVKQFGKYENTQLLIGHCRLRDSTRTFRVDRILECVDMGTGEIVADVHGYLRDLYENSPEFTRDKLAAEHYDALRVLLFIGKADGQLRAAEKRSVCDACRRISGDSRITEELIGELLLSFEVPSIQSFRLAVGRLVTKPAEFRTLLLKTADEMVSSDKTVRPAETEALEYMKKRLGTAQGKQFEAIQS